MQAIRISLTTDSGGAASQTFTPGYIATLYAVEWDGSGLSGGTLTVSVPDGPNGATTIFSLAAANVKQRYYPRVTEHDATGASASTTTYPVINGSIKAVIASGGSTRTANLVVYLLEG